MSKALRSHPKLMPAASTALSCHLDAAKTIKQYHEWHQAVRKHSTSVPVPPSYEAYIKAVTELNLAFPGGSAWDAAKRILGIR